MKTFRYLFIDHLSNWVFVINYRFKRYDKACWRNRQLLELGRSRMSDVSNCKDLPDEIPLRLNIGTKVTGKMTKWKYTQDTLTCIKSVSFWILIWFCSTARLRGVHDGLFTGQIDAVDTSAATYRVTFDRNGLGTHTVPDYEVLVRVSCWLG